MSQNQNAPAGWYADPNTGQQRWWDGTAWAPPVAPAPAQTPVPAPAPGYAPPAAGYAAPGYAPPAYGAPGVRRAVNGFAVAALALGIWGFLTTWIPLFIGLFLGGIPDVLAIVFGIIGIVRARATGGSGMALAIVGLVLGGLAFLSIFLGAGTIW